MVENRAVLTMNIPQCSFVEINHFKSVLISRVSELGLLEIF
jgi:hypothetical protein